MKLTNITDSNKHLRTLFPDMPDDAFAELSMAVFSMIMDRAVLEYIEDGGTDIHVRNTKGDNIRADVNNPNDVAPYLPRYKGE